MATKPVANPLSADLPTNWTDGQIVAPNGPDVSLSAQHGYNYLMTLVNAIATAANAINDAFPDLLDNTTVFQHFGTCSTAAGTAAKAVTVTGTITTLTAGDSVRVLFSNGNTAASPTLNVNNTGAIAIQSSPGTAVAAGYWAAGAVVDLVYTGSAWLIVNAGNTILSSAVTASTSLKTLLSLSSGANTDDAFSAVLARFAASSYAVQKLGLSSGALTNAAVDKLAEYFNTYTWVKTHYDPDIAGTTTPTSAYTVANSNYKYVAYADSYELTVENGVFYVALINPSFITATMSGAGASTLQGALRGKYMIVPGSSSGGVTRAPIGGSNPGNWGGTGGQVMKISSSATFSYVSSDPAIKVATGGLSLVYVLPKSTSTILTSTSSSAYPQNAWNGVDYYDFRGTLLAGAEGTLRSAVITFEGAYTTADLSMEIVLPFTAKAFMLSAETKGTSGAVSSGSTSMAIWVAGQTYIPVSGTASTAIYAAVVQSGNTITITPASVNDALKKAKWRMIAFG